MAKVSTFHGGGEGKMVNKRLDIPLNNGLINGKVQKKHLQNMICLTYLQDSTLKRVGSTAACWTIIGF